MTTTLQHLISQRGPIRTIGVVGMGYVGIPSATLFAASPSFSFVWGVQRDSPSGRQKIEMLNRGENPLKGEEQGLTNLIQRVVADGKFRCTSDFSVIRGCDAVTIAIQTPFLNADDLLPDLSSITDGLRHVGRHLTSGSLVVIESTVTPGSTEGSFRMVLEEESGLKAGRDFALAHAPERVMVGQLLRNLKEHDRIVGGIDPVSTQRAIDLYRPILVRGTIIPMTATAAEVEKTAENALRDLQIAAANQLALYCEVMGVNFYDVREGIASLREEGVTRSILWPGAGVGGHCLTKDTYHLERGLITLGKDIQYPSDLGSLFLLARRINNYMPQHMIRLTRQGLSRLGKQIKDSTIAILGWAFIANSDDTRNTPSEYYRNYLLAEGASVKVHDPFVQSLDIPVLNDLDEALSDVDVIAILTGHAQYRIFTPESIKKMTRKEKLLIIDGRHVIDPDPFIHAGFVYQGIGRGDKNSHQIESL